MITVDQLLDIVSRGEQLDVEFKADRVVYSLYGLAAEEIVVVEGKS